MLLKTQILTVELQWLKQAWYHENWFQSKVVPASQGKFIYLLTISRDLSPEYGASKVRVFVLLVSFPIFSGRWSLNIENETNSMKT